MTFPARLRTGNPGGVHVLTRGSSLRSTTPRRPGMTQVRSRSALPRSLAVSGLYGRPDFALCAAHLSSLAGFLPFPVVSRPPSHMAHCGSAYNHSADVPRAKRHPYRPGNVSEHPQSELFRNSAKSRYSHRPPSSDSLRLFNDIYLSPPRPLSRPRPYAWRVLCAHPTFVRERRNRRPPAP